MVQNPGGGGARTLLAFLAGALTVAVIAIGWFVYSAAHRALEPPRRPALNIYVPRTLPPEGPKMPPPPIPQPK